MFAGLLRFLSFSAYLLFFFAIPFGVLWDWRGMLVGLALFFLFFVLLGWNASRRIQKRMGAELLSPSEVPVLFTLLAEHCRRLTLPLPRVYILKTEAINAAAFGFSHERSHLVFTQGMLSKFSREQLSAIVARLLVSIWHRNILGGSWLSQFLALLDSLTSTKSKTLNARNRHETFIQFFKRIVFYPLALFPIFILSPSKSSEELDSESVRVSRKPRELAEALRMMESLQERLPLYSRFSLRHLFLITPISIDPIAGILFKRTHLKFRIENLLNQPVAQ